MRKQIDKLLIPSESPHPFCQLTFLGLNGVFSKTILPHPCLYVHPDIQKSGTNTNVIHVHTYNYMCLQVNTCKK